PPPAPRSTSGALPSWGRWPCGPPRAPGPSQSPRRAAATPDRGAPGLRSSLLRLLVRRLLVAARAVLLPLGPLGVLAPVLRREVVPALARRAFHDDVLARHSLTSSDRRTSISR